jgi:pseudouridylate synthase
VKLTRPRVALESTLITHGLAWPRNLEAARRAEAAVRRAGADPTTFAIIAGQPVFGLADSQLEEPARAERPMKASRTTLALAIQAGAWAGTTVSATMHLAASGGISVFATGGIGGVHRGGAQSMDISSDLDELARTSMIVVCSGPKSILDVDLTLEYLETRGVPIVGWQTRELAGFYVVGSGRMLAGSVDGAEAAAHLFLTHWQNGLTSALVVAVPVPDEAALPRDVADAAIDQAIADAAAAGVHGPATTPWVLSRVAELTDGRSIEANLALIENNARVAGEIAVALKVLGGHEARRP